MLSGTEQICLFMAALVFLVAGNVSLRDGGPSEVFFALAYRLLCVALAAFMFVVACSGSVPW